MRILPFSEAIQRAIQKFHKLISLYGWRVARPIDYKVSLNFLATSTLSLLASQHHHYDVTSLISLNTITGVIFEAACFFSQGNYHKLFILMNQRILWANFSEILLGRRIDRRQTKDKFVVWTDWGERC